MVTLSPCCRNSPFWTASWSGALSIPRTAATVIDPLPVVAEPDPPVPGTWQPAASTAADTDTRAMREAAALARTCRMGTSSSARAVLQRFRTTESDVGGHNRRPRRYPRAAKLGGLGDAIAKFRLHSGIAVRWPVPR